METNVSWVERFYKETEREDREEIFEAGMKTDGMTPENEFRKKLWNSRYVPTKKEKGEVDHFFKGILSLNTLSRTKPGFFNRRMIAREIEDLKKSLCMDLAEEYGEMGQAILYEELKHLGRTYISICQDDKNFSSLILGIGRISKDGLAEKIASSVYKMAYTVPKLHGFEELMAPVTNAFTEAYYEFYPKKADRRRLENRINGTIIEEG